MRYDQQKAQTVGRLERELEKAKRVGVKAMGAWAVAANGWKDAKQCADDLLQRAERAEARLEKALGERQHYVDAHASVKGGLIRVRDENERLRKTVERLQYAVITSPRPGW